MLLWQTAFCDSTQTYTAPRPKLCMKCYLSDVPALIVSPFKANGTQWAQAGVLMAATGASFALDKSVVQWEVKPESAFEKANKYFLEPIGSGLITLPVLGGVGAYAWLNRDQYLFDYAATAGWAFVLTRFVTQVPKYAFQRERPLGQLQFNPFVFHGPFANGQHKSFPSGHTASMFALAAVSWHWFEDQAAIGLTVYALATATGISRISQGEHWFSDVVAGAALGYLCGRFLARRHLSRHNNTAFTYRLTPYGAGFSYSF